MFHKNQHIQLTVRAVRPETPGYLSVVFERPRGFGYEAGDWMDIEFTDAAAAGLRGGRTYSFSSSPTESELVITLREGISPFKRALQAVRPGDRLYITQYGNAYDFQLRENKSSVLIAGGVGVAPFRSMLKEAVDAGRHTDVLLIYFNQSEDFLFKPEIEAWAAALPGLAVQFIVTTDLKRKDREKLLQTLVRDTRLPFYVAGPPGMVASTVRSLTELGVDKRSIRLDSFDGY